MKKMMFVVLLLVGAGVTTLFASDDVNPLARRTFDKQFPDALFVKWEKITNSDTYMVRFVYNNQVLISYIDEKGDVLATARTIEVEQLPFMANEILSRRFTGFRITMVEELNTASEVSYFATMENDKITQYVRIYNNGTAEVLKKGKKRQELQLEKK